MVNADGWRRLVRALEFYQKRGWEFIETPWAVSYWASMATAPNEDCLVTRGCEGFLVGSAEQGFIQRVMDDTLAPGKYVSIGPCFRSEEVLDDLHQEYFMKVELFRNDKVSELLVEYTMEDAASFFRSELSQEMGCCVRWVRSMIGCDLELSQIELGSYGIRAVQKMRPFIYGTGLAEPRFSRAVERFIQ